MVTRKTPTKKVVKKTPVKSVSKNSVKTTKINKTPKTITTISKKKVSKKTSSKSKINPLNPSIKVTSKNDISKRFELGVGGQAVIEGVMMKKGKNVSIAVRKPDDTISVKKEKVSRFFAHKIFQLPMLRGILVLLETLVFGMKALTYSANESIDIAEEKLSSLEIGLTMIVSFVFAIGLFIILPLFLTNLTSTSGILFNLIDGIIRVGIFVIYILVISLMSDVKILFGYHGAEHKAVACYENGEKLTVDNAKKFPTAHRRCGTTFILIVLALSIIVFSLIPSNVLWVKFVSRLALVPVIAGLSYEILKLGAKYPKNKLLNCFVVPGLLFQKLTTREPTDRQLEVAVKSLNACFNK